MSTKFQVVIPKAVRERVSVQPGQKFLVYESGGMIYLVPQVAISKLRGILKGSGVTPDDLRDKSDRP